MSIPLKLSIPQYSCVLPSTGDRVEYRPYVVREEKILLVANESNDPEQISIAIKNVIALCTFNKIDIAKLPLFDIEYLYLMIRAKTRGEEVTISVTCNNRVKSESGDETVCGHVSKLKFNLVDDVKVKRNEKHTTRVMLSENQGVVMKYPTILDLSSNQSDGFNVDSVIKQISRCIDVFFEEDPHQEYYAKDYPFEDVVGFVENLTEKQYMKLTEFLETMPKVIGEISYTCKKCSFKHKNIEVSGLQDFLA